MRARTPFLCLTLAISALGQSGKDSQFRLYLWRENDLRVSSTARTVLKNCGIEGIDAEGPGGVATARGAEMPFYVDHAVPKNVLHLGAEAFSALRNDFASRPSTASGVARRPCLSDPVVRSGAEERLKATILALGDVRPDFLSLGDECSLTRGTNPLDLCFDPRTLATLPDFLEQRWGSKAAAHAAWGPFWPADGPPRPPGTVNARAAVFHGIGGDAPFIAWSDFRAFSDRIFTELIGDLADHARNLRPGLRVGLLGCPMPSAFGGYDWERLASRLDVFEIYDDGGAADLVRGLAPPTTKFVHTLVAENADALSIKAKLWRNFLRGDVGAVLFWSKDWCDDANLERPSPLLKALTSDFKEITGPLGAAWLKAEPAPPEVALIFTTASARINWLFDTREDGESWINRLTSYESQHGADARTRASWIALCEDLGLRSRFVTTAQLRDDAALRAAVEVVVLPRQSALSDGEIRDVVSAAQGKLLAADARLALFTHRFEPRAKPAFDALFGFERDGSGIAAFEPDVRRRIDDAFLWPAAERNLRTTEAYACRRDAGAPQQIVRRTGNLMTTYFNLDVGDYIEDRRTSPKRAAELRRIVLSAFSRSLRQPRWTARSIPNAPAAPVVLHVRRNANGYLIAVEIDALDLRSPSPPAESLRSAKFTIKVTFPVSFQVTDLRSGADLGTTAEIECVAGCGNPVLLGLRRA